VPKLQFAVNVRGDLGALLTHLHTIYTGAAITAAGAREVTLSYGDWTYTISGRGLETGLVDGTEFITGGTIRGAVVNFRGNDLMAVSQLGIDAAELLAAAGDEQGADVAAFERIVLGSDWIYVGNGQNDLLFETDTSDDGIPLNLSGNDRARLGYGNDSFFLGDGNDIARGGAGEDSLYGGRGNDLLVGGGGRDLLEGGQGRDRLLGGDKADYLSGGDGADELDGGARGDWLDGGRGDDRLTGGDGAEADHFVFRQGDGDDVITDFQDGIDRLDITTDRALRLVQTEAGVRIDYGSSSILLLGIDIAQITAEDYTLHPL
jgi:Ca2+-binding RTX toxin-like protein